MPRQARPDAPGILQHVMIRGIERGRIFDDDKDRSDFIKRMGELALETETKIYAWALMANHPLAVWVFGAAQIYAPFVDGICGYVQPTPFTARLSFSRPL